MAMLPEAFRGDELPYLWRDIIQLEKTSSKEKYVAISYSLMTVLSINSGSVLMVQNNTDTSSALSLTRMNYASASLARQTVREDRQQYEGAETSSAGQVHLLQSCPH